ncbi:MAG: hypothetical protein IT240_02640 [Bacteroidia bacterium]|nr:hypothetical protein [Bacteroidia bacterium]
MESVKNLSDPAFYTGATQKNIKHGSVFPVPIMGAGAILIVVAAFLLLRESPLWIGATAALVIGVVLLFSTEGIDIDKAGGRYKEWNRWFGIRVGKWKPLDVIESVSVILETDTGRFIPVTENSPYKTEDYFQVYLMNDNHHYKVFVCQSRLRVEAETMAKNLASWLSVEVRVYQPQRQGAAPKR